jgi:hypothetical protein
MTGFEEDSHLHTHCCENLKSQIAAFGGRIILKWILKKKGVSVWTRLNWLKIGSSGRVSERQRIFFDQLIDC